jgi:long-chain fatty acid transport protein
MSTFRNALAASSAAIALIAAGSASAAGFYIQEQSVTGLGRAFAGSAAMSDDVAGMYFNPANMTGLTGKFQAETGVNLLIPSADLKNQGTTFGGVANAGSGNPSNPYDPTLVPYGAAAMSLMDGDLWLGVHAGAPFGLASDYGKTWFGRYDSTKTDLKVYQVSPSIAYAINDQFSIGAGVDIQRAEATLEAAVPVTGSTTTDRLYRVKGDDWDYGFNVGMTYKPVQPLTLGASYRSAVSHKLDGTATLFSNAGSTLITSDGSAGLDLPDMAIVSAVYDITPDWRVMGSVNWFGWSNFQEIAVDADNAALDTTVEQNYKNTFAFSIGGEHDLTDSLTIRAGIQYDETPTQDNFRTSRTPDGNRLWLSTGVGYKFNDVFSMDAAYTFINISDEDISLSRASGFSQVEASSSGKVHIIGLQGRLKF